MKFNQSSLLGSLIIISVALIGCSKGDPSFSKLASSQTFEQTKTNEGKIDILWVVDNSGSMIEEQENLANNFQSFIASFNSKGYEYQMSVITTDAYFDSYSNAENRSIFRQKGIATTLDAATGNYTLNVPDTNTNECEAGQEKVGSFCFVDSNINILTPESLGGLYTTLEQNFITNTLQGNGGSGDERAFDSVVQAFELGKNDTDTFLREDSFFSVIIVSDEEDCTRDAIAGSDILCKKVINIDYATATPEEKAICDDPNHGNGTSIAGSIDSVYVCNNGDPTLSGGLEPLAPEDEIKPISEFVDFLDNLDKTRRTIAADEDYTRKYNINSIGIFDQTCIDQQDWVTGAQLMERHAEVSEITEGVTGDICGDFADSLSAISSQIISLSTLFFLSDTPTPGTISVSVDGELIDENSENGWTYVESKLAIQFHGSAIPESKASIIVDFDPTELK